MQRLAAVLTALAPALSAQGADGLTLSAGFDYSSGNYGGSVSTELATAFATAGYTHGPMSYKLTLPWLDLKGPAVATASGNFMIVAPGASSTNRGRVTGPGDPVVSATWAAWSDGAGDLALDLTGKLKLATADSARGLSTGKNDSALQASLYRAWGDNTLMLSGGYKWMGKPEGSSYRDAAFASTGVVHRFAADTTGGIILDWRQSVLPSLPDQQELTVYAARALTPRWTLQGWLYAGFNSASPDLGGGASLGYRF